MQVSREQRRQLERDNAKQPAILTDVPVPWPSTGSDDLKRFRVLRSRYFLVQCFNEEAGLVRLSICRTSHTGNDWVQDITWEELQQVKREAGYGNRDAVEIYPRDRDVVNVANMRHLWVWTEREVPFAWRRA